MSFPRVAATCLVILLVHGMQAAVAGTGKDGKHGDAGKEGCGDDEQEDDNGKCCGASFLGMDGGKFVCCEAEVMMADNGACPASASEVSGPCEQYELAALMDGPFSHLAAGFEKKLNTCEDCQAFIQSCVDIVSPDAKPSKMRKCNKKRDKCIRLGHIEDIEASASEVSGPCQQYEAARFEKKLKKCEDCQAFMQSCVDIVSPDAKPSKMRKCNKKRDKCIELGHIEDIEDEGLTIDLSSLAGDVDVHSKVEEASFTDLCITAQWMGTPVLPEWGCADGCGVRNGPCQGDCKDQENKICFDCTVKFYSGDDFSGYLGSVTSQKRGENGGTLIGLEDEIMNGVSSISSEGCSVVELYDEDYCTQGDPDNLKGYDDPSWSDLPWDLDNDICAVYIKGL